MVGPTWFQEIVGIASGILTLAACIAMLGAIVFSVVVAGKLRRLGGRLASLEGIPPLLVEIRGLVRNLDGVITALREDVEAVRGTVAAANNGAREVVRRVEDRVERLDTLVGVVQEEIEATLVGAVAAARGARAGMTALSQFVGSRGRDRDPSGPPSAPSARHESWTRGGPDEFGVETQDSEEGEESDANEWRRRRGTDGREHAPDDTGTPKTRTRPRRRGR